MTASRPPRKTGARRPEIRPLILPHSIPSHLAQLLLGYIPGDASHWRSPGAEDGAGKTEPTGTPGLSLDIAAWFTGNLAWPRRDWHLVILRPSFCPLSRLNTLSSSSSPDRRRPSLTRFFLPNLLPWLASAPGARSLVCRRRKYQAIPLSCPTPPAPLI